MKSLRQPLLAPVLLFLLALAPASLSAEPEAREADLVIYGGTSAGVVAAVQAARLGKTALLIAPGRHLGGLSSSGLGWTDTGRTETIGGVSREFYQRIHEHYSDPEAWPLQEPETLNAERGKGTYDPEADAMWAFEPKVAEAIFEKMIAEAGKNVTVLREERLDREDGVRVENGRIAEIATESGIAARGKVFFDATYEGDLLAAAGVSYRVGREDNEEHDEFLNGVQPDLMKGHRFIEPVDPYVVPGDPSSGLVARVEPGPLAEQGSGDKRIQAYNYRMCMSDDPRNRVPFPKPEGYDESEYELLFRNFEAGDLRFPMILSRIPNHKTDTNNKYAFSTDNIGMNYGYPEGSYAEREKILAEHERYQKGLMWTLANHPRVPQEIREAMEPWGLAADEFTDNGHWPHQIYVREGRRMVGEYIATELDCRRIRVAEDSVGLGSYNMDSHNVQRYVTAEGTVQNEGDVQQPPGGPYVISYRSLVPKKEECGNLLVPVAVSSSHIAFGSIRMEPVFMILGHSAASAAAIAIDRELAVQDVPYADLRDQLLAEGQVLDLPEDAEPKIRLTVDNLPGIVVDDTAADQTGHWSLSSAHHTYLDIGYLHDARENKGEKSLRFTADLPGAGEYEVRFLYPPNGNRSKKVPVTVHHAGGETTLTLDQRKNDGDEHGFVSLGRFRFEKGEASVVISTEGTEDGHVAADAVQFLDR